MDMKRVGLTISLALLVSIAMPVSSVTNDSYYADEFRGGGEGWTACRGDVGPNEDGDWPDEHGHVTHERTYMVAEDNDDTADGTSGSSLGYTTASNESLPSFKAEAILQRDSNYTTPDGIAGGDGQIGLVFGLTSCDDYYMLLAQDGETLTLYHVGASVPVALATMNGDSRAFDEHLSGVDHDHLYTVTYDNDTDTLSVYLDGFREYVNTIADLEAEHGVALPSPQGELGIVASDNNKVFAQRARYLALDDKGPQIEVSDPVSGETYVAGIPLGQNPTNQTLVVGDLTIRATLSDGLGVKQATIFVDGERLRGGTHAYGGETMLTDSWTIETGGLSFGMHTVTIEAVDLDRNRQSTSIDFVVLPTVAL